MEETSSFGCQGWYGTSSEKIQSLTGSFRVLLVIQVMLICLSFLIRRAKKLK